MNWKRTCDNSKPSRKRRKNGWKRQKGNQHAKAGGGQGGGKDRHHSKVGSLLGSGKIKELEADNRSLQNEIAAREEHRRLLAGQSATAAGTVRRACHGADRLHPKTGKEGSGRHICKNGRIVRAGWFRFFADAMRMEGTAVRRASRPSRRTGFSPSSRWNTAETSTPKSTRKASP